jgi:hypothetical protein
LQHRLTAIEIDEVLLMYNSGKTLSEVASFFGVSAPAIAGLLQRRGVVRRSSRDCQIKCKLNHNILDEITPESAYWIGFIFADGTVGRRNGSPEISIALAEKDRLHLEKAKSFFGSTHSLIEVPSVKAVRFSFRSEKIASQIEFYGRRHFNQSVAHNSLANSRDFWRGLIDGDGWFRYSPITSHVQLIGGFALMTQFSEFLVLNGYCKKSAVCRHKTIFAVSTETKRASRLLEDLYVNATVSLDRKAEKLKCSY